MFQPLGRVKRKRKAKAPKLCMTHGCGREIPRWRWLCDGCFRRLPFARRKAIAEACEERAPTRIFGLCRDGAQWLAEQREKLVEAP